MKPSMAKPVRIKRRFVEVWRNGRIWARVEVQTKKKPNRLDLVVPVEIRAIAIACDAGMVPDVFASHLIDESGIALDCEIRTNLQEKP